MYSHSLPMAGKVEQKDENAPLYDESKDACDPVNFKKGNLEEEVPIRFKS